MVEVEMVEVEMVEVEIRAGEFLYIISKHTTKAVYHKTLFDLQVIQRYGSCCKGNRAVSLTVVKRNKGRD